MGRTKEKLVSCVRSLLAFLFSQVGLCAVVVGYAVLGALIFESLEADNEIYQRQEIERFRDHCVANVRNLTEQLEDNLTWGNWTSEVGSLLKDFEDQVVRAVKLDGYDGKETNDEERQWSFSGALLYSVTVITTIGYGNLAPKTPEGKIVTMMYALLGIPLMLLCLSNIGSLMASTLQFAFGKICCDCNYHRRHDYEDPTPSNPEYPAPAPPTTSPVRKSLSSNKIRAKSPSELEDFSDFEYDHIWESFTSLADQMVQKEVVELYILDRLGWEAKSVLAECAEYTLEHDDSIDNQCYESTARLIDNIKGSTCVLVPQEQLTKQYQESSCPSDDAEAEISEPDVARGPLTPLHASPPKQQQLESSSLGVSDTDTPLGTWPDDATSESSVSTWNSRHWLHKDLGTSKSFRNRFKRKMSLPTSGSRRLKSLTKRTCNKSQQTDTSFGGWTAPPDVVSVLGSVASYQNYPTSALPTLVPRGSSKQPTIMEGLYFAYHDPYLRQYLLKPPTPPPPPVKVDVGPKDVTPQVPVPVVLFLVVGYICIGALVFSAWEEWSFLDGAYFSFITLSTIGFGDLVPGHRVLSAATREGQTKLVICCLYLVIGLAIIAMSFSLVQNEVVSRCKRIGKELGIIR